MAKHSRFMIFRTYRADERPDIQERAVFYGWSHSKNVVIAFLKQRSKKKYKVQKVPIETIEKFYGEDLNDDTMVNYVPLISASTNETVDLFITKLELQETERKIQQMFRKLSSLDSAGEDIMEVLELFMNLDPYYGAALYYLGFRPPEIDALFPSADYHDDYADVTGVEEMIDDAYNYPGEVVPGMTPAGLSVIEDVSKKIIYSLESFIKVLRDDM